MALRAKTFTLVLLGRPGCGKGTQAKMLARDFGLKILGTGALLRRFVERDTTPLCTRLRKEMAKGNLMPSWLVFFVWMKELIKTSLSQGVLFDGSPRKIAEAELIDEVLEWLGRPQLFAVELVISEQEAAIRLRKRGRSDDTPRAILERLSSFERAVRPVIERYRRNGNVLRVNGEQPPKKVFRDIVAGLGRRQ